MLLDTGVPSGTELMRRAQMNVEPDLPFRAVLWSARARAQSTSVDGAVLGGRGFGEGSRMQSLVFGLAKARGALKWDTRP